MGGILLAFSEKRTVVTKLAGHCGVGKEAFSIQMFVNICSPPPKLLSLCPPSTPSFRSSVWDNLGTFFYQMTQI